MTNRTLKITAWACHIEHPNLTQEAFAYTLNQETTPHVRVILPVDVLGSTQQYSSREFMAPDYSDDQEGEFFLNLAESQEALKTNTTLTFCQAVHLAILDPESVHFGDALWAHPTKEELFALTLNPHHFEHKFQICSHISERGTDAFWDILPKIVDDLIDQFDQEQLIELVLIFPESLNPWSLLWLDFIILMTQKSTVPNNLTKELQDIAFELDLYMLDEAYCPTKPLYFSPLLPFIKAAPDLKDHHDTQKTAPNTPTLAQPGVQKSDPDISEPGS